MKGFFSTLILASCFLVGCQTSPGAENTSSDSKTDVSAESSEAPAVPYGEDALATFKTPSGKFVCPIMKSDIANEDAAFGYVVHDGVKYLVCCEPCEKAGQKDPAALAAKAQELK